MAGIVYSKLIDALKGIGVDVSQQQASNVSKLTPKNQSTATKVGLLASERDRGGNFATVLDIFKDEAKYIDSMNDAEQMAFLNNILDYNEFGGKSIGVRTGIEATEEMKKFKNTQSELKKALEDLQSTTEKNKNQALKDLDDFMETGGQPFKKKDTKFLGGSMHEEGQLRTGIRQFLQTEYKNGRLKLNDLDKERVMQYSPMIEHDPILVFKKIYGDEAYKKAGSFPGAFEIGENFKHYEKIFRENMGEDLLKVKNKEYVGDGKLILTEQEEVFKPTPDDDDMPFAKGGRASFAGGKLVSEFIAMIVKKEPIEAMKEVNKVIGKKGKYKNLTQKDIDKIVADTEDWIFQRDPDNLYVYDDGKTIFDDDLSKKEFIEKEGRKLDQENIQGSADDMSVEDSLTTMEGLGATQTAERFRLKQKYPGITDSLLDDLINDPDPNNKARALAALDEAMTLQKAGKSENEIIEILKNTPKKEMATGGRAGFGGGGSTMTLMDGTIVQIPTGAYKDGKFKDIIYSSSKGDLLREEIVRKLAFAQGGRAGFYAGGQSMIEPDLSDIGHGSDALMARNRLVSPGSQATTSTGLNYLLGEDNDNTRIPFATKGRVDLADLESLKNLKKNNSSDGTLDQNPREPGLAGLGASGRRAARSQSEDIKNKVIGAFAYAVDNLDQETKSYVKSLFNDKLQVGYETTMSGIKQDAFGKTGLVPIDDETIYKAIVNLDLPQDVKLKMSAITDKAGNEKIKASLKSNSLGLTWDNEKQEIIGKYTKALSPDGSLTITPIVGKDENSNIVKDIQIDKAFDNGTLKFSLNESDIFNKKNIGTKFDGENISFFAEKNTDDFGNTLKTGATVDLPVYLLNKDEKPTVSFNLNKNLETGFESKMFSGDFPITDNLSLFGVRKENDSGFGNTTNYGLEYNYEKPIGEYGNFFTKANIDNKGDYGFNIGLSIPFGEQEKKAPLQFSTNNPEEAYEFYKKTDGFKKDPREKERPLPIMFAEGGIAGLRPGYAGGDIVDKGRRGFLKLLGVTAGGVAALKTGLVKILGKDSGAISKKVIDEVIIDGGTGAPAWLQPLVNKALREGTDKTKSLAYKDAQEVKRLDTPTGQVDVYYDVRTGEVEIDYIGGNTALGESVNMRYTPGIADEGTKGKPADEFSATESIPEGRQTGPDDFNIEMGENTTDNVKNLFSDTTELAELGGQKTLTKDIVETVKKKKVLKQMENDSAQFVTDVQGDFVPD
jgi:hypothetical protein